MKNFPRIPVNNQVVTYKGYSYKWSGRQWVVLTPPDPTSAPVYIAKTPPKPPIVEGSLWLDTSKSFFHLWAPLPSGQAWVPVTSEPGLGLPLTVSNSSPKNPSIGALWYSPISQTLSVWSVLTNPESWVPLVNSPPPMPEPAVAAVSETDPLNPYEGTLWYESPSGSLKTWLTSSGKGEWKSVTPTNKTVKIDSSQVSVIYVGKAPTEAPEASPLWSITKSTFSLDGTLLSKKSARNVSWTGRTQHTYF